MTHKKLIEGYSNDINNLSELLLKLVNAYRLLIAGAHELNSIALASKSDIKDSLKKVDAIGEIIDSLINSIEYMSDGYVDYCKLKTSIMKEKVELKQIVQEVSEALETND